MFIGPKSAASLHGNTADICSHAARKYQLAVKLCWSRQELLSIARMLLFSDDIRKGGMHIPFGGNVSGGECSNAQWQIIAQISVSLAVVHASSSW